MSEAASTMKRLPHGMSDENDADLTVVRWPRLLDVRLSQVHNLRLEPRSTELAAGAMNTLAGKHAILGTAP